MSHPTPFHQKRLRLMLRAGWIYGRIFQRALTNPKPVYSSVPHHRPWFEPVCTGIELTATPCAVITNVAPLHFAFFFVFLYPTPLAAFIRKRLMFNRSRSRPGLALAAQNREKPCCNGFSLFRQKDDVDPFVAMWSYILLLICMFLRRQRAQGLWRRVNILVFHLSLKLPLW